MSFFGSGISGSLTEEMLFDESFLLVLKALLSSECLGTSVMRYKILNFNDSFSELNTGLPTGKNENYVLF